MTAFARVDRSSQSESVNEFSVLPIGRWVIDTDAPRSPGDHDNVSSRLQQDL
jgi:hypothetical protein